MVERVVQVLPYAQENGTERHVLLLSRELLSRGVELAVASPEGPIVARFREEGIPWVALPRLTVGSFGNAVAHVAEVIGTGPRTLVHVHAAMEFCWALRWKRGARLPLVFTAHCYHQEIDYAKAGLFLAPAAAVIAVSYAERARLVRYGVPTARCHRIPNGILPLPPADAAAVRAELGLASGEVLVGAIGRLTRDKGHALLIRAVGRLAGVRLAIVGDGPDRDRLEHLAHTLNCGDRVHLLGRRTDVPEVLAACDLYASASRREGLSLAALEALHAGKPVVLPDIPDFGELVSAENGKTFRPGDMPDLARVLGLLSADAGLRARLAEGSRRLARQFDARRTAHQTLALYEQVLGRSG